VSGRVGGADAGGLMARAVRRSPIYWLILSGVVLIAAIIVGTAVGVGNRRGGALSSSERELENTVLLLARHFDQQLEEAEVIQNSLVEHVYAAGIATAEDYRHQMSGRDVHLMLKAKLSALSYVGAVTVFDSNGKLINASGAWPVPDVSVADRAYFKVFISGPQSPTILLEPVYSRVTGAWTTIIARKVTGTDGAFLGSISRGVEPAHFEKFFASLALGDGAAISMFDQNGTLLARHPHNDALIGRLQRWSASRTGPAATARTRNAAAEKSDRRRGPGRRRSPPQQVSDHRRRYHGGFSGTCRLV